MKCPNCSNEMERTPNSEKWKDPNLWWDCHNCLTRWKIYKSVWQRFKKVEK